MALATIMYSLVHLASAFLKLSFGAEHTLLQNQTIAVGQTLVSENLVFELGFFHPRNSRNMYLGIWHNASPDIVVWVANRNNPIVHSQGIVLAISVNGTLAIRGAGIIIWSAMPSEAASRPALRLLDTGNLVVVDEMKDGYSWQSFDYPTDTWLPGMKLVDDAGAGVERYFTSWRNADDPSLGDFVLKIENQGLPELVFKRGEMKISRSGQWNGIYFGGFWPFPTDFVPGFVFREERMISLLWHYDSSIITKAFVDVSGAGLQHTMNTRKGKWSFLHSHPRDQCDQYGICGPNSICIIERSQRCSCLRGFSPKFQDEWDLKDWSGGCARTKPRNCRGGDGFQEMRGVKYPDMLWFVLNTSMSLHECKAECLKNCNCTACANSYITNGGTGCVMWYGDLIDTRKLSEADALQNLYIRVPVSELDFETNIEEEKTWSIKIILISIASGAFITSFINGGLRLLKIRKKQALKKKREDIELPVMKMATVREATNNFSVENMIGVGGFGHVYKGKLSAGEEIAVKRLSKTCGQGLEEFKNEVVLIAKLQHRNLVRLFGCCIEGDERMLIYEYLPNKSLDYFVFDQNQRTSLTWPKRFDIIMGIARGLLYLHHDSRLKIIHRDFKTSNILLDEKFNPKISDFGLARISEGEESIARTKRVVGTHGYMAPEYAIDGKFSVKSDVFALGVVLLEIISGKKNREFEHYSHQHSLLGHAWLLWREDKILELVDECLNDSLIEFQVKRCIHVALLCVQKFTEDRPFMPSVLFMLGSDGEILPDPKEPGFFFERSWGPAQNYAPPSFQSENETITITDLEAR